MFIIFTYLLYFFVNVYQLLIFYRLNQYKIQTRKDIFKIIVILITSLIIPDFLINQVVFLILVICLYGRKHNVVRTINTILFANLLAYAADLFFRLVVLLVPRIVLFFVPLAFIYFVVIFILIERLQLYQLFVREKNYLLLCLIIYAFIALHIIALIIMRADQDITGVLITGILLFIQFLFMIYVFYVQNKIFERNLKNKLKKEREESLELYLQTLEYSEEKLRRFKHDYQNMLLSLRKTAKKDNSLELVKRLNAYSNKELDQGEFEKFKDLTRVKDIQVKSLLISKINELEIKHENFKFECTTNINNLDKWIDPFDLSRIIGIVFDNAIEACENQLENEIKAFMFQDERTFTFEIKNKIQNKLKLFEIQQAGFSTKKNHQGVGLDNIELIKRKYPNLFVNYQIKNKWFIFSLNIIGDK